MLTGQQWPLFLLYPKCLVVFLLLYLHWRAWMLSPTQHPTTTKSSVRHFSVKWTTPVQCLQCSARTHAHTASEGTFLMCMEEILGSLNMFHLGLHSTCVRCWSPVYWNYKPGWGGERSGGVWVRLRHENKNDARCCHGPAELVGGTHTHRTQAKWWEQVGKLNWCCCSADTYTHTYFTKCCPPPKSHPTQTTQLNALRHKLSCLHRVWRADEPIQWTTLLHCTSELNVRRPFTFWTNSATSAVKRKKNARTRSLTFLLLHLESHFDYREPKKHEV